MADASFLEEMEHLVTPFCYSAETLLPNFGKGIESAQETYSNGFISEDCTWGCAFNDYKIQCFSIDTQISDVHYKSKSQVSLSIPTKPFSLPPGTLLRSACELALHKQRPWAGGLQRLLLGLDCTPLSTGADDDEIGLGALAIYDQVQQQILKWIPLPEPVSCIKVLSHSEAGDSIKPFFNPAMMAMVGIATVGMAGGKVLVVDLGLDRMELPASMGSPFISIHSRKCGLKPTAIVTVDPFDRQIATQRHVSIRNDNLISFYVGDPINLEANEEFVYNIREGPDKKFIVKFDKDDVAVSAVEYVANIGCLLVGYNFGGFQLWRVDDLSLVHGSTPPDVEYPVYSFGFQQPIDDPKNFCYIWVLFGSRSSERIQPRLELYQLFFMNKANLENFGFIYQNLQKFLKNLSITLEDFFLPPKPDESIDYQDCETAASSEYPLHLSVKNELVFVSWKVERSEMFYVGIFDLNAWYSSHTPTGIPKSFGFVPYWVAVPVERSKTGTSTPWDFRVLPSTIQRWESRYQPVDFHMYPASITFQGVCLTSRGYFSFDHFGVQEKIIRLISKDGAALMAEPAQLQQYCYIYGLQPRTAKVYEPEIFSDKEKERFLIFTVLLENKRPSVIVQLANAWLDGSYSDVGCTVNLIIDWIKDLSLSVRSLAEDHWSNVLHLSTESLLPDTIDFIGYSNFIWNSLHSLLSILIRHDEVYNSARSEKLDSLKYSLKKLVEYSAAMLMFYQSEILPSKPDVLEAMAEVYNKRRLIVYEARNRTETVPEEYKKKFQLLVIDQLVAELGEDLIRREWNLEGADHLYPPKHTGYILNMLLWKDAESPLISRVMFYFIVDFCSVANMQSSILKGDFASVIQLNGEEQQEIYKMWRIDHGFFEDPVTYMAQNSVLHKSDVTTKCWSAAMIVLSGFIPESAIVNLLNLGCPSELPKLYFVVLGRIPHLREKLMSYVSQSADVYEPDLLHFFFQVAFENNFIHEFINRYLLRTSIPVQVELKNYLQGNYDFDHQNFLLEYYITLRNVEDARQLYEHMSSVWGDGLLLSAKQKQTWLRQRGQMTLYCAQATESMVMNFLKTEIEAVKPIPSPVAIRSKKVQPSIAQTQFSRITGPSYQSSPLRHYAPKIQRDMDDSLGLADEGPNESDKAGDDHEKMMESLLKTPSVDHRRFNQTANASSHSVCYETPQSTDMETHSILKKSASKSGRMKPYRTRFIDPSSGKELKSPELGTITDISIDASEQSMTLSPPTTPLRVSNSPRRSPSVGPVGEEEGSPSSYRQRLRSHDSPSKDNSTAENNPMPEEIKDISMKDEGVVPAAPSEKVTPDTSFNEEFLTPVSASPAISEHMGGPSTPPMTAVDKTGLQSDAITLEAPESPADAISVELCVNSSPSKSAVVVSDMDSPELFVEAAAEVAVHNSNLNMNLEASFVFEIGKSPDTEAAPILEVYSDAPVNETSLSLPLLDQNIEAKIEVNVSEDNSLETKEIIVQVAGATNPPHGSYVKSTHDVRPLEGSEDVSADGNQEKKVKLDAIEVSKKRGRKKSSSESSPNSSKSKLNKSNALVVDKVPKRKAPSKSVKESEKLSVSETNLSTTAILDGIKTTIEETTYVEKKSVTKTRISAERLSDEALKEIGIFTDDSDEEAEKPVNESISAPGGLSDTLDASSVSMFERTSDDRLELGPRRLTRRQKSLLEARSQGHMPTMGEAHLTPPKHSPVKEKSPARSVGRKRKDKSGDDASIASADSKEKSPGKRRSRRSTTPESDISETSERRQTRSATKKLESGELDVSFSGSQSSVVSQGSQRSTRSRSRGKTPVSLSLIFDAAQTEEVPAVPEPVPAKKTRRRTSTSRAASEPPSSAPTRRSTSKRKAREVMGFAPEMSTVVEDTQENSLLSSSQPGTSSGKRKRSTAVESISEEPEADVSLLNVTLDTSTSGPSKRGRRSMTPSLLVGETQGVTTRRRRHSSSSK